MEDTKAKIKVGTEFTKTIDVTIGLKHRVAYLPHFLIYVFKLGVKKVV